MSIGYFVSCVAGLSCIVIGLRYCSFLLPAAILQHARVLYLAKYLPSVIMTVLVFYSTRAELASVRQAGVALVSLGLVAGLHLWRRSFLLSIFSGSVCYILLAN